MACAARLILQKQIERGFIPGQLRILEEELETDGVDSVRRHAKMLSASIRSTKYSKWSNKCRIKEVPSRFQEQSRSSIMNHGKKVK